jgi:hypothetical protein
MEMIAAALFVLVLLIVVIYNQSEISMLKYGVLRALATQSKVVDSALQELIATKDNHRITNKEYRRIEKIYLTRINVFLVQHDAVDDTVLREAILNNKRFQL